MRNLNLLFAFILLFAFSANAQLKKIYETKMEAHPAMAVAADGSDFIEAGEKQFDVIELSTGKVQYAKTYKEAGASFDKIFDVCISETEDFLFACDDKKTVTCFDTHSGIKVWENKSFVDLGSEKSANSLISGEGVVIVSDKLAKDNYSLTCLDSKTGNQHWTIANEPEIISTSNVFIHGDFVRTKSYFKKNDKTKFKFYDIQSGKLEITAEFDGSGIVALTADEEYTFIHHRVSEKKSFLSAIDLKSKKVIWTSSSANNSPNLPMVLNTDEIRNYAKIDGFEGKVLLITEGIEAFDITTGKSVYNIPFVPYYKWGVGHYIDAIFQPQLTENGILLADATDGDIYIKYYDRNNGKLLWSSEKQKNINVSPKAQIIDNRAVIQFGGVCVFEVLNRSEIGKFLDPYKVTAFDLKTGKVDWNIDSKKGIFTIENVKGNIMIVGEKDLQTIDSKSGAVLKTENNPLDNSYFMTHVGLSKTKFQKDVSIDFDNRIVIRSKDDKLIKSQF